jgi:ABC-type transport system involved in multi-copper enzyme maturation permease subunit
MKFLAILRDSLRETLDAKLFYFLAGLSVLVCALVASVTYKPSSVEDRVKFLANLMNLQLRTQLQASEKTRGLHIDFLEEGFERTNDAPEPWRNDFRFNFVIRWTDDKDADEKDGAKKEVLAAIKRQLTEAKVQELFQGFLNWMRDVDVQETPGDPNELLYVVTAKGSKAVNRKDWAHEPALFFGAVPIPIPLFTLNDIVAFIGNTIVGQWGNVFITLISIIVTAFFLPSMLAKGSIDLLLAKPIWRVTLFLYKFIGGLLFMFLNTAVIMIGVWLSIGLQSGLWVNSFLVCIFIYTFQFAVLYAVSAAIAVFTRSSVVAILGSLMVWGFLVVFGWAQWGFIENQRDRPPTTTGHWAYITVDALHAVLPRYEDVDWLTSEMIEKDVSRPADPTDAVAKEEYDKKLQAIDKRFSAYSWPVSLSVSGAFIVLVLGLACWRFTVKDY